MAGRTRVATDLSLDRLAAHLSAQGVPTSELTAQLIRGGRSNLTYRLGADTLSGVRPWVLRRPPLGHLLATAQDMGREYRVISALRGTEVPMPETVQACGRLAGLMARQARRWTAQLAASRGRALPGIDGLACALDAAVPSQTGLSLIHGDFRLVNCMLCGCTVVSILGWEMATLGGLLADVALFAVYTGCFSTFDCDLIDSTAGVGGLPCDPLPQPARRQRRERVPGRRRRGPLRGGARSCSTIRRRVARMSAQGRPRRVRDEALGDRVVATALPTTAVPLAVVAGASRTPIVSTAWAPVVPDADHVVVPDAHPTPAEQPVFVARHFADPLHGATTTAPSTERTNSMTEEKIDGGELVARTLAQAGVSRVFTLHGGHLEAFYRACAGNGLELVDFRHEASAGHASEAYARVTGELGVCAITAGPGFANALPAILNALVDASPTLFLIGAPPLRERETNELQGGFDQLAIARPSAKWAVSITNVERIPELLAQAIRRARTGRRGPVVVELPIDVLHSLAPASQVTAPAGLAVAPRPAPSREEVAEVRLRLLATRRPVIIVGGHARFTDSEAALSSFVERAHIPVFASKRGLGLLPAGHPLDGHDASNLAALAKHGVDRPDLVILAGTRLGLFLGGSGDSVLPRDAALVQVYGDADEIGRIRDIDVPVVADVGSFFDSLLDATADDEFPDWSAWAQAAVGVQRRRDEAYPDEEAEGGIHPYHAAAEIAKVAGTGAIYAVDGGEAGQWAVQHARTDGPGRVITTGYLGGLGVGPGYAVGAQIAAPDRRVVLVTGDGSFGFHLQELDIMVHRGLPIVTVVLNNEIWGMSLHGQQIMYGQDYSAISLIGGRDYAGIARAFGAHAERVSAFADLRPALERAFAAGGPAVVEVMTDPDVVSPGLVEMLGDVHADIPQIVVPYYENIPL